MKPCAVIIWDRAGSRAAGRMVTRACGAPTRYLLVTGGDTLFAVCGRHDERLRRAFPTLELVRPRSR